MLRRILTLSVACAMLVACQSSAPQNLLPQSAANGAMPMPRMGGNTNPNELPEPPVVRSVNGVARVKLDVTFSGATGFPQFVFDGMAGVAPTIRVKPGDTIVMDLKDDLTKVNAGDSHDINVHFHGLGSSPLAPGDDVLGTLARPGQKIRYVVHVPATQGPGLYWYHPHIHGQTNYQVGQGGMSGAIVVEGLQQHFPQLAHMRERVIVLRDTGIGANAPPTGDTSGMAGMAGMGDMGSAPDTIKPNTFNSDPCGPEIGLTPALNGAVDPTITIAPGEKQFFRVINATGHKTAKLAVPGEKLTVLAVDGFAVDIVPRHQTDRRGLGHHSGGGARRVHRHRSEQSDAVPQPLLRFRVGRRPRSGYRAGDDPAAQRQSHSRAPRAQLRAANRRRAVAAERVHDRAAQAVGAPVCGL